MKWSTLARLALYLTIGCGTAAIRFLGLVGFSNDHYVALAGAQQMLFGEWPTRDFLDPGLPLMYAVSAAAQMVFGRNLFAEAMLVSTAFGLAALLTTVAVRQLTGSMVAGVVAALLEVAIFPLTYSYPKTFLYAAAPLLIWWYVRRPSSGRLGALAAFVVIAFLFRHDHGLYLGAGAAVGVALAGGDRLPGHAWRRLALFAGFVGLAVLPYLVFVAVNGGVLAYLERGLDFTRAESERTTLMTPPFGTAAGLHGNSVAFLYYVFLLLPVGAALMLLAARGSQWRARAATIAPVIAIALLANRGFLRETLSDRLPDAVVPAVLLAAWLACTGLSIPHLRRATAVVATIVIVASAVAVAQVGHTAEQLNRASVFGGIDRLPERFGERSAELHDRFAERQMPAGPVSALVPMFEYLDRCTTPEHRLLLPGFIPEVGVYARRRFAGGRTSFFPGAYRTPSERLFTEHRLASETVAVAVVTSTYRDSMDAFLREFIASRFEPVGTYSFRGGTVDVLVNRDLRAAARDKATGWPCFHHRKV